MRCPVGQDLAFHGPKFPAIAEKNLDEVMLLLDSRTLLDDEHRHEAIRKNENNRENWHQAPLFPRNRWHNGCAAE